MLFVMFVVVIVDGRTPAVQTSVEFIPYVWAALEEPKFSEIAEFETPASVVVVLSAHHAM